jgi:hypothetical protein
VLFLAESSSGYIFRTSGHIYSWHLDLQVWLRNFTSFNCVELLCLQFFSLQ